MKYNYKTLLILCMLFSYLGSYANKASETQKEPNGYKIEITAPLHKGSSVYLAQYANAKPYILDSLIVSDTGKAIFSSSEFLPSGQYVIYIKPDLQLDLLIDEKQQSAIALYIENNKDLSKNKISGSNDTELLWQYLIKMQDLNKQKNLLIDKISKDSTANETQIADARKRLNEANKNTLAFMNSEIEKHRGTWFSAFIKNARPLQLPHPEPMSEQEVQENTQYGRKHYFDNIDLTDSRLWNTNYFPATIDSYMQQWVEQQPDTLAMAASKLVGMTKSCDECFGQMLIRLINQSLQSQYMGMENIWSKLAEDYVWDKHVPGIDSTQEMQLRKVYETLQYNRIGMTGHDLALKTIDGSSINTGDMDFDYLVLYFYDPNCSHCQTEIPQAHNEFYQKYKDKGVKVVAISLNNDMGVWRKFVDDNKLTDWINAYDPEYKSQYWLYYDTSAIPNSYVLNKNKKIIAKKIDASNMVRFFEYELKRK